MESLEKIKKKKFLIIGSGHKLSLERSYIRAFKNLKIKNINYIFLDNGFFFSLLNKYKYFFLDNLYTYICTKKIYSILRKNKFDFIFIFKGMQFEYNSLLNFKKIQKKAKWINIYTDNPFNFGSISTSNQKVLNSIKFYDYFCVSFNKKLNFRLKKLKANKIIYLPFGYDVTKHKINKIVNKKSVENKINFVGSFDNYRKKYLNDLNFRVDVFGPGWKNKHNLSGKLNINSEEISGSRLKKIISKYAISINLLRKQDKNSHNMRTFEIPAMGGLMLTNYSKEQDNFFKQNKECYMYKNKKDLLKKINYIFSNPKKAYKTRKNGFFKSNHYSYETRLKNLLSNLK